MPLLALHLLKSRTEAIRCVLQIVPYAVVEKGMKCKGEQWLGSVVCDNWSCCGCRKGTSQDKAKLNSGKIKPVAIASIELSFSEGIN